MALQDKQKINRTIVLPFTESDYDRFMNDLSFAKEKVAHHFQMHPELFPADRVIFKSCGLGIKKSVSYSITKT